MSNVWMIIIGMTLVTYIPRTIPFYMIQGRELPVKFQRFLEYVPYTALGALIIPGAIMAIEDQPLISAIGLVFAGVFAYFKGGLLVPILGSIGIIFILLNLI